ncbi:MAG: hypothetical protein V6Z81_06430 [Parvularculales bacterium]
MSNENSLPHFSDVMNGYVMEALSVGKRPSEVAVLFRLVFPYFGEGVDEEYLKERIFKRICDIRKNHRERIDELKTAPEASKRKIRNSANYRLSLLIDLFNKAPRLIPGEKQDKDNLESVMKVFEQMRIEMDRIDGFDGEPLQLTATPSKLPETMKSSNIFGDFHADSGEEDAEESSDPPGE